MRRIWAIIRNAFCAVVAVAMLLAIDVGAAQAVGESVNGFPSWAERVIHEWINRARVDPQLEMNACGAPCVERACYGVMPPLSWSEALNRSARFHSDEMVRQGYFAHTSACTLVSNINSLYPALCNGSAACACVGGVKACSPTCTDFAARVSLFAGNPSGEIIASPSNPNQAFYLWLFEPGDTANCQFTSSNGHRWLILKSTGAVGAGVAGYSTGDFGSGTAPAKIPSGTHYPQQAATVEAWANWYDSAGPTMASVNVDGTCTPMNLGRGTQTNGAWSATLTGVGSGCHRYYFSFRDAAGTAVTFPTSGSLAIGSGAACPDWDSARPAACPGGTDIPTPSATPSPAATATATSSPTRTFVAIPTLPRTPTSTATSTRTATPSATATAPPSPTPTATVALSGDSIAGFVRYYSNDLAVPGIDVHAGAATIATSDVSGHYLLANVPAENLVVYADGTGGGGSAISPLDAAWVLQSVAGMRPFSPEQVLACDVTGNGSLSTLDATLILQYSVGLLDRLPVATACDSDWVFIPLPAPAAGQTLIAPQSTANGCTPGAIAYESIVESLDEQNFAALVFGDCTGNWRPPTVASTLRAASALPSIQAGQLRPLRGGRLALPIAVESARPMHALEVRVTYDATALRVVHPSLTGPARDALLAINAKQPGVLRIAIASSEGIAGGGRPLLVVVFDALRADRVTAPSVVVRLDDD